VIPIATQQRRTRDVVPLPIELTTEVEMAATVPGFPDGPDGENQLAHPERRLRPRHAEPLFDMLLDL
jgi:hypothetical protein